MSKAFPLLTACAIAFMLAACSTPTEPDVVPPQPQFADTTAPPNPVDRRIYADVDAERNAIVIEWKADSTNTTSGYILYRSFDSTVGADGLLASRIILAQFESSNSLGEPLPTSYQDTTGIAPGGIYWYQLQAFYRSPTNKVTYSAPTHVDHSTSFQYARRLIQDAPAGAAQLPPTGLQFRWENPDHVGTYQIILQRVDNQEYEWSYLQYDGFESTMVVEYPATQPALVPNVAYRWRIKVVASNGGSSSPWQTFSIVP